MEKWLVQTKKADFKAIGEKYSISDVTARIIRNRDIIEDEEFEEYIKCDINRLESPFALKDMEKAVELIIEAINADKKIRIIGDYDTDGVCSGYILTTGLEVFGANVDFDIPDRVMDGYGINERLINKAKADGVELIITCDNGIAAKEQIAYANKLDMEVIVTDHHEVQFEFDENGNKINILPDAKAVIDPKQEDCYSRFKELCGAGVVYKLVMAIYEKAVIEKSKVIYKLGLDKIEKDYDLKKELLIFAGIATIADVVDLIGENRSIAKNGLKYIAETKNMGLLALIEANELNKNNISSYQVGFVIGPCINAGGRLDTGMKAFELFRCQNDEEVKVRAKELKELNDERKELTFEYTNKAIELVKTTELINDKFLIIYLEECHESIAGIIAGKIKDEFYKPTIVFTDSEDGIKGSGRSVEAYDMYGELVKAGDIFERRKGKHLFKKFGGHKMAVGLTIDKESMTEFSEILNSNPELDEAVLTRKVWIDVALPFQYITENFINELNILEPFGKANEKPVFAEKCPEITRIRVLGKNKNFISINVKNSAGFPMEAILFADGDKFLDELKEKFGERNVEAALKGMKNEISMNIVYYPEINEFREMRNIRVVIKRYSC